jgi:cytochrome c553
MKNKGRIVLALVLGVALFAAFTLAYAANKAPEKDIVIDTKDVYDKKKKTPVVFPHAKHKEFKCTQCHHVYKDGKNVWKEGDEVQKCGACHKDKKDGKKEDLKDAFHDQCIKCHKKLKKERGKDKTGPYSCSKCHPREKK